MKNPITSKSAFLGLIIASGLTLAIYSCKKDSATTTDSAVTESVAAELTTDAIVPSNGGFAVQVSSSVNVYKTVALNCGLEKDSTITKASASGVTPSYNYSLKWSYILSCNGLVPNMLTVNFTGTSSYDNILMSSSDKSTGTFVITGLPASATAYTLNSTYSRIGSQTSKIGRSNSFTSTLTVTSSNIMVDKTTQQILSGSAVVAVTGSSTSGASFSYGGTVTFLGSNKATLVLNSGVSYPISW